MELPKELTELLHEGLSYPGWEEDVARIKCEIVDGVIESIVLDDLAGMRREQRYHEGDRSFNEHIIRRDEVVSGGLSYGGRGGDVAEAEICCVK